MSCKSDTTGDKKHLNKEDDHGVFIGFTECGRDKGKDG